MAGWCGHNGIRFNKVMAVDRDAETEKPTDEDAVDANPNDRRTDETIRIFAHYCRHVLYSKEGTIKN